MLGEQVFSRSAADGQESISKEKKVAEDEGLSANCDSVVQH